MKLTKNNLLLSLAVIGLVFVALFFLKDCSNVSKFEKEVQELRSINIKLKEDAKKQESDFKFNLDILSKKSVEVSKKLDLLKRKNDELVKVNKELSGKSLELEKNYAKLEEELAKIKVPVSLVDRANLFRKFGY